MTDQTQTPAEKELVNRYWHDMFQYQLGQPGVHDLMKQLRAILDEYPGDRMLVGEDENPEYMGSGLDELHIVFNFPLMNIPVSVREASNPPLTPARIRQNQKERLELLLKISPDAWPCNTLGNHDSSRVYTHYADGIHDAERARLALAVMLTLKGTPFLYNGEEIGMTDYIIADPARLRDTMATWFYQRLVDDLKVEKSDAARRAANMSRDKNRTPMQWSNSANAGFCPISTVPWLPVNPNYASGINVRDQHSDPLSLWHFYKRMLKLRKSTPALVEGEYQAIHENAEKYLAFLRKTDNQIVLVLMNFSKERQSLNLSELAEKKARTLFSSAGRSKTVENLSQLHLAAFEIYIAEL